MEIHTVRYRTVYNCSWSPILLHNTRCARGHGATASGDGRYSSGNMGLKGKTLQQEGQRSEEDVEHFIYLSISFVIHTSPSSLKIHSMPSFGREVKHWVPCRRFVARERSRGNTWKTALFG
jgi:hypothetical protein